ncbi:hypothetical protein Pmani_000684 [Petrolisthes manimaculis]|uniref:Uncharacterized protein n=1 Tax=Petrolisthes manimaculis TaxID=1843537 RepID=A0AAE1QMA5_9EUCA|nr:hypothetical protein Pmani_000684 [Petrolisthes manimaculis]
MEVVEIGKARHGKGEERSKGMEGQGWFRTRKLSIGYNNVTIKYTSFTSCSFIFGGYDYGKLERRVLETTQTSLMSFKSATSVRWCVEDRQTLADTNGRKVMACRKRDEKRRDQVREVSMTSREKRGE